MSQNFWIWTPKGKLLWHVCRNVKRSRIVHYPMALCSMCKAWKS